MALTHINFIYQEVQWRMKVLYMLQDLWKDEVKIPLVTQATTITYVKMPHICMLCTKIMPGWGTHLSLRHQRVINYLLQVQAALSQINLVVLYLSSFITHCLRYTYSSYISVWFWWMKCFIYTFSWYWHSYSTDDLATFFVLFTQSSFMTLVICCFKNVLPREQFTRQ